MEQVKLVSEATRKNWKRHWLRWMNKSHDYTAESLLNGSMKMNKCTKVKLSSNQPTLRDQFAMAALQGLMAGGDYRACPFRIRAKEAYELADAMMEARND